MTALSTTAGRWTVTALDQTGVSRSGLPRQPFSHVPGFIGGTDSDDFAERVGAIESA